MGAYRESMGIYGGLWGSIGVYRSKGVYRESTGIYGGLPGSIGAYGGLRRGGGYEAGGGEHRVLQAPPTPPPVWRVRTPGSRRGRWRAPSFLPPPPRYRRPGNPGVRATPPLTAPARMRGTPPGGARRVCACSGRGRKGAPSAHLAGGPGRMRAEAARTLHCGGRVPRRACARLTSAVGAALARIRQARGKPAVARVTSDARRGALPAWTRKRRGPAAERDRDLGFGLGLGKDWIIEHPRNPYTPVTKEDDKSTNVLSEPGTSSLAESRQQQNSLRKGGLRYPCVILILELVTIGQAESSYHHHQPYRWVLRNLVNGRVIREIITAGPPSFAAHLCELAPIEPCLNQRPYYLCSQSNPEKGYCNSPNQYYCAYWDCVTIASAWTPPIQDKYLTTTWGPLGCKHPRLDWSGGSVGYSNCDAIILQVIHPEDSRWVTGRTWGIRYWEEGQDRGGLIHIRKEEIKNPPQGVGPNSIISGPEITASPLETTQNDVISSLDGTREPPLWKLMRATYDTLNQTNPNLTAHCWLCYDVKPPFYEAIGVNTTYSLDT
ncbi:uncharacterized protein LOC142364972 [Opisthocomus hoazin]|uniref:uncharacterized protein LOC142364972 n=1 Tax=Opisthocomus hoazin TaxID=30419 RepID=UPI003F52EAEA